MTLQCLKNEKENAFLHAVPIEAAFNKRLPNRVYSGVSPLTRSENTSQPDVISYNFM